MPRTSKIDRNKKGGRVSLVMEKTLTGRRRKERKSPWQQKIVYF